jgi:hypothetical protein
MFSQKSRIYAEVVGRSRPACLLALFEANITVLPRYITDRRHERTAFRPMDYEVASSCRRILHRQSGLIFKFASGRRLTILEKRELDFEAQIRIEDGARRALDLWPRGSIS